MKDVITYQDFAKLDLRVGRVLDATIPDWSDKLMELTVNFGSEIGQKTILAGIKNCYQPQDLIDNNYLFVVNLAERKMGPGVSQGMMLMIDRQDEPIKFELPSSVQPGEEIR